MVIISFIPLIPLLFYLVDGYLEKDLKKGFLHIGIFIALGIIITSMLFFVGWTFALWTPLLLLFMLSIKPKNKPKALSCNSREQIQ